MEANRFITTENKFNNRPLKDAKFGGAILLGNTASEVGALSVESSIDRCPYSLEDWTEDTRVKVFVSGGDRFTGQAQFRLHLHDIPKVIELLQKTYDDFSALDEEVQAALKITQGSDD